MVADEAWRARGERAASNDGGLYHNPAVRGPAAALAHYPAVRGCVLGQKLLGFKSMG